MVIEPPSPALSVVIELSSFTSSVCGYRASFTSSVCGYKASFTRSICGPLRASKSELFLPLKGIVTATPNLVNPCQSKTDDKKRQGRLCGIPYLIHKIQIHVYIQYTGYCDVLNQTMHLIHRGYVVMMLKDVNLSYINKKDMEFKQRL